MAAISMTGDSASARSGLRLLAFAWLGLFALLVLLGIAVFVFGKPAESVAILTFPEKKTATTIIANPEHPGATGQPNAPTVPATPGQPPATIPVPPPTAVPTNITAPVYAGRALVADPALIENTA